MEKILAKDLKLGDIVSDIAMHELPAACKFHVVGFVGKNEIKMQVLSGRAELYDPIDGICTFYKDSNVLWNLLNYKPNNTRVKI